MVTREQSENRLFVRLRSIGSQRARLDQQEQDAVTCALYAGLSVEEIVSAWPHLAGRVDPLPAPTILRLASSIQND